MKKIIVAEISHAVVTLSTLTCLYRWSIYTQYETELKRALNIR